VRPKIKNIIYNALKARTPNRASDEYYPIITKMDMILKRITKKLAEAPLMNVFIPCCGAVPWEIILVLDKKIGNNSDIANVQLALSTVRAYDINNNCAIYARKIVRSYLKQVHGISSLRISATVYRMIKVADVFKDKGSDVRCLLSCNPPFYSGGCDKIIKHLLKVYSNIEEMSLVVPTSSVRGIKEGVVGKQYSGKELYKENIGIILQHLRKGTQSRKGFRLLKYVNNNFNHLYLSSVTAPDKKAPLMFIVSNKRLCKSNLVLIGIYNDASIKNIINKAAELYSDISSTFLLSRSWSTKPYNGVSIATLLGSFANIKSNSAHTSNVKIAYTLIRCNYRYKNWQGEITYV